MNLTGQGVYQKNQKRKARSRKLTPTVIPLVVLAQLRGSEREYLDWLKTQPSARGTGFDYDWEMGTCTATAG